MRTPVLLALALGLACDEPKEADSQPSTPAPSQSAVADTPKADDAKPVATPKANAGPLECDQWLAADLLKTHCGVDLPFVRAESSVQTELLCSRGAKDEGGGRVTVTFEKLIGGTMGPAVRRRYPEPPELKKGHSGSQTVKGRTFPYLLTVDARGKELCTDEQVMALTQAILGKLPAGVEPASKENAACDALLTPADIKAKCKTEGRVNASMMEDGKSLYCNRSGDGLIFIVSKHASDDLAMRGAEVAREDTAAGVAHKGPYSIELKTSMGGRSCDKAGLDALAELVAGRL